MTYVIHYEDEQGDLIDVEYYCGTHCLDWILRQHGIEWDGHAGEDKEKRLSWGGWPGGAETDYNVYCGNCGVLLWEGIEEEVL